MNAKRPSALRLLAVIAGAFAVGLAVIAGVIYRIGVRSDALPFVMPLPAAFKNGKVLVPSAALAQRFIAAQGAGEVTDLAVEGDTVIVAGEDGAVTLGVDGRPRGRRLPLSTKVEPMQVVGRGDGWALFTKGWTMAGPSLLDSQGRELWHSADTVMSATPIDWDGNGSLDFALGYDGDAGVELQDMKGRSLWRRSAANPWVLKAVETTAGKRVLVSGDARGDVEIWDRSGRVKRLHFGSYVFHFADLPQRPGTLVIGAPGELWLADLKGNVTQRFEVQPPPPEVGPLTVEAATLVSLDRDRRCLAVIASLEHYPERSVLLLFSLDGTLVYEELLGRTPPPLLAVERRDRPGTQSLLVGGTDEVVEYRGQP